MDLRVTGPKHIVLLVSTRLKLARRRQYQHKHVSPFIASWLLYICGSLVIVTITVMSPIAISDVSV